MPAPLPIFPLGYVNGSECPEVPKSGNREPPKIVLEVYVDFLCPFSSRIYNRLKDEVAPCYGDLLKIVFFQVPQPWHPQGTYVHEMALAVQMLIPRAYGDAYQILMDNRSQFEDIETFDKTRTQIYEELATLCAGLVNGDKQKLLDLLKLNVEGGQRNSGNAVTGQLKLYTKHHRQRGVHVTPTCAVNGILCDTSSGWSLDEWKLFLDPIMYANPVHK